MSEKKKDELLNDHNHDGIDRRGFLEVHGLGRNRSVLRHAGRRPEILQPEHACRSWDLQPTGELSFVQISDSHMGFNKAGESRCGRAH